jgi:hypothetical protein
LLQSLLALSNTVAPAPAAQEPVAARNVPLPPFVAAPSPFAGKSLHNQFPEIESDTLLEIVHHNFKPNDLFKLSLRACDRTDPDWPESSKKMSRPYAAYPSLHSLLTPLTTYFSVLQSFAASSGDASAASSIGTGGQCYIAHILDLHQRYEWLAVVEIVLTRFWFGGQQQLADRLLMQPLWFFFSTIASAEGQLWMRLYSIVQGLDNAVHITFPFLSPPHLQVWFMAQFSDVIIYGTINSAQGDLHINNSEVGMLWFPIHSKEYPYW